MVAIAGGELVVKNLPANAGDRCRFDPWVGKIPGEEHGDPLQCSCLENPMDRVAWWATVHRVAKSRTRLMQLSRQAGRQAPDMRSVFTQVRENEK